MPDLKYYNHFTRVLLSVSSVQSHRPSSRGRSQPLRASTSRPNSAPKHSSCSASSSAPRVCPSRHGTPRFTAATRRRRATLFIAGRAQYACDQAVPTARAAATSARLSKCNLSAFLVSRGWRVLVDVFVLAPFISLQLVSLGWRTREPIEGTAAAAVDVVASPLHEVSGVLIAARPAGAPASAAVSCAWTSLPPLCGTLLEAATCAGGDNRGGRGEKSRGEVPARSLSS